VLISFVLHRQRTTRHEKKLQLDERQRCSRRVSTAVVAGRRCLPALCGADAKIAFLSGTQEHDVVCVGWMGASWTLWRAEYLSDNRLHFGFVPVGFPCRSRQRCVGKSLRQCGALRTRQRLLQPPPPLDYTSVAALVHSVKQRTVPGRLETVLQPDARTLYLGLRTLEIPRVWLTLSWHPQLARLTAVPERKGSGNQNDALRYGVPKAFQAESMPYSVSNVLRSREFRDLILCDCRAPLAFERLVEFDLARRPGEEPILRIILELVGTRSNLVVLGGMDRLGGRDSGDILACGYQLAEGKSDRPFRVGDRYVYPATVQASSSRMPSVYRDEEPWRERLVATASGDLIWRGLTRAFVGLSSALAQDMVSSALGSDALERCTEELEASEWHALFSNWLAWLSALERHDFAPHRKVGGALAEKASGRTSYSMVRWPNEAPFVPTDASDLIADLFDRYEVCVYAESMGKRLRRELAPKLKRVRNALAQYTNRLAEAEHADQLRARGDLLMAWQHLWQPGETSLRPPSDAASAFESWKGDGLNAVLEIAPGRTPVEEAQACYQRSRKLRRAVQALAPLEQAARRELEHLEHLEYMISVALDYGQDPDLELLQEVFNELHLAQAPKSGKSVPSKRGSPTRRDAKAKGASNARLLDRCIQLQAATEGSRILCGKSQHQNDYLTFRVATESDLWFHAQGCAGSHCILRMPPGFVASTDDVQLASDVAAYFSKARLQKSVPVVYTQIKYVRRADAPGTVKYANERVIFGEPDRARAFVEERSAIELSSASSSASSAVESGDET